MIKHLRVALKVRLDHVAPTAEAIASSIESKERLSPDLEARFEREGNPFIKKPLGKQTVSIKREPVLAMNRLNRKNKLSPKTIAELDRLRKEKMAG